MVLSTKEGKLAAFFHNIRDFFPSSIGIFIAVTLSLILFFAALGTTILYIQRSGTSRAVVKAFKKIKDFMIKKEPSLKGKNGKQWVSVCAFRTTLPPCANAEILRETQKLADKLVDLIINVTEIEDEIEDISKKLHQQWVLYKEVLYLFEDRTKPWHKAITACEDEKSMLITIGSLEEEEFLERETNTAHQDSWIGLPYKDGKWQWYNGIDVGTTYWKAGMPHDLDNKPCAILKAHCSTPKKCWENIRCDKQRRWICKKMPDKRWYT
ncbi:C-type lectin domain family 4 member M-like [Zootoca vivipara]|uniref:C-type lectin domain family 4 member M-like n=1 Tax=Zootoca vivipara TaxID=8524 RepID=UPI00293BC708|nr:C-type lectin domain family 4 member M-like [Zootoca vivipara]